MHVVDVGLHVAIREGVKSGRQAGVSKPMQVILMLGCRRRDDMHSAHVPLRLHLVAPPPNSAPSNISAVARTAEYY